MRRVISAYIPSPYPHVELVMPEPVVGSIADRYALPRVDVYRKDTRLRFALKASPTVRRLALALRKP